MMKETACFTLLDFEPSEDPPWRRDKLQNGNVPSVNEMLDYIIKARQQWKTISESRRCTDNRIQNAFEELEVLFIYHTCQQEDVGIADEDIIRQIIKACKDGSCEDRLEHAESGAYKETVNFYQAYKKLQELGKNEAELDPELKGLLEVDSYIIDMHKHLMRGLSMKTPGGKFSTEVRHTIAHGEIHVYPTFETHEEARDAVMRILDRYNMLCFSIKGQEHQNENLFLRNIFKCSTWLFHQLLSLHPFGDGNGRLCRLILNYAIHVVMPFPVPLHDIWTSSRDAYLDAVIAPRKSDGRPRDLMRLLVESSYDSWKRFLNDLKQVDDVKVIDSEQPSDEEITKSCRSSSFKCAMWLFHQLLSLHPFVDGNGRLCRLILNCAIHIVILFLVPLRDIWRSSRDAYIDAVIAPRKSDGQPRDLMRLLVESTFDSWKRFLNDFKRVGVVKAVNSCLPSGQELEEKPTQKQPSSEEMTKLCRSSG